MTKEQVYAAKEMYTEQIRNNATRLGINPEDYCNSIDLVTSIMKKTSSELVIKRTLRSFGHLVQMQQRIDLGIWEEE